MLMPTIPGSFAELLAGFRVCFTAPSFATFTMLLVGLLAQPGTRTVTGMLTGARLGGVWHHARAHRFFATAHWSAEQLGLAVADLIVGLLVPAGAPLLVAVDDSLFKRSGRKVFGAGWHHDAAAAGRNRVAWGNNWVVVGIVVSVPLLPHRKVCLPVLARLWQPQPKPATATTPRGRRAGRRRGASTTSTVRHGKTLVARELVEQLCARYPDRVVHIVADAAYATSGWRNPPARLTVTSRLRADAALYQLPPTRRAGQRGRPRVKGERMPQLIVLAALVSTVWQQATVVCYGQTRTLDLAVWRCLWHGTFGTQQVQVVLARPPAEPDGYELAIVSTDLDATAAELVERYADRWSIEVCFEEARQVIGVGQARNRTRRAVERTVPFGLLAMSLLVVWYARHGKPRLDVAARRARAPWYHTKHAVSLADMLSAFRRELLRAQFSASQQLTPTLRETLHAQLSWLVDAA
jgi:SRSO17 transposase